MIQKIICPVDFSKAANNAIEYAAKLSLIFNAELLLVNVQQVIPVAAAVSLDEGIGASAKDGSLMASQKLKKIVLEIKKEFKIAVDYEVDITTKSLAKILASFELNNVMIVMGSNGVDEQNQYFFGTNTYKAIKKAKCPLLMIPENVSFKNIKKIVFAWDYSSKSKFSFSSLADFMKAFDPYFTFLHISKEHTEISSDVFKALRGEVKSVLGENPSIDFEQLFSENIPETINKYMIRSKADMLALTFYNRGAVRDIFHGTVAKELCAMAKYPVLVLHA